MWRAICRRRWRPRRKLQRINSEVVVEGLVADVTHDTIDGLAHDVDVIVDGTDNFATRFLVNDYAVKRRLPWVYGGAIGAEGQTMTIVPGQTACLACLMHEPPPPGVMPTCDTAGILGSIIGVIASIQVNEAMKILSGNLASISSSLTVVELWENRIRQIDVSKLREQSDCRVCKHGEFNWLAGKRGQESAVLCGRNAVQLAAPAGTVLSLEQLAKRVEGVGPISQNPYLLRLTVAGCQLTVFPDGRTIVSGTDDVAVARSLQAKYVGA